MKKVYYIYFLFLSSLLIGCGKEELTENQIKARDYRLSCERYNNLRKDCATAGSISKCMETRDATLTALGSTDCALADKFKDLK
jgi:major membrane immunogen (membrane-anchored lipoprotein)